MPPKLRLVEMWGFNFLDCLWLAPCLVGGAPVVVGVIGVGK